MDDTPIDPEKYIAGVTVVDIGDARVARGKSRRPYSSCKHRKLNYDNNERRIWCEDCEKELDAFDAFEVVVKNWHVANERATRREIAIKEAESHALINRAAKVMDIEWRKQRTAPCCPHCKEAILPSDVASGVTVRSKQLVEAARKRKLEGGE